MYFEGMIKLKGNVFMKKKLFVTFGIFLILIITSFIGFSFAGGITTKKHVRPSDYKIGISFNKAIVSDKPMLVLFYADWCGYCLKFMPKFAIINTLYSTRYSIVMIDVEDPAYKGLVDSVMLTGFPTVMIIDPKYDNRQIVNPATYQDISNMSNELDRYLRIRKLLDKAPTK